jgi:voltage-gated potassium channel
VREKFHRLLLLTALIVALSSIAISLVEPDITPVNGIWWTIVTMTTVGYGDISPHSLGGRIIAVMLMFFGIGVLGMFSASVASVLVQHKLREERGLTSYRYQNHMILCEWNHRTASILSDLRADPKTAEQAIVLIADLPTKPVDDDNLVLIAGNVNDDTLLRANLAQAQTVVVLGDDRLEPTARDAKVVLAVLTIESINRAVYTIVELVSDANVRHCQRAGANEIIVNNALTSGMLARAALDHGITKVISDWLSLERGDELYKIATPGIYVNKTILEVLVPLKQEHGCLVIGVQSSATGEILANPPGSYRLDAQDQLIVVCADRPQFAQQ